MLYFCTEKDRREEMVILKVDQVIPEMPELTHGMSCFKYFTVCSEEEHGKR